MADFTTHVTTSSILGIGYAGGAMLLGAPIDASLVAGGLCGVSGMLPDIDSDSGIPVRESMSFLAAIVPILLVDRFQQFGLGYETMVLIAGGLYCFVRFGVAALLKHFTVHRGMFHSIPAAMIFTMLAFLICGSQNLELRYLKAGGVLVGVLSHLVLDEFWSVEWYRGQLRVKKSFGTAIKFVGEDAPSTVMTYLLLVVVLCAVLSEPMLVDRFGIPPHERIAQQLHLQEGVYQNEPAAPRNIYESARAFLERLKR